MIHVLFVCLGNICRSPTAEGVFRHLVERHGLGDRIAIDSAGTGAYHIGNPPDSRSQAAARLRGVDLSTQRARQVSKADFDRFDYVLAMDTENLTNLLAICPPDKAHKVHLMLDFAADRQGENVPDPYYGEGDGFEIVLDMIETASQGLLDDIRNKHLQGRP